MSISDAKLYDFPCEYEGCLKVYATQADLELHQTKRGHVVEGGLQRAKSSRRKKKTNTGEVHEERFGHGLDETYVSSTSPVPIFNPNVKKSRAEQREEELKWKFQGARGRWDVVIVFDNVKSETLRVPRGKLLRLLRKAGLLISKRVSENGRRHFYLVSATRQRLELQAELMGLEMQLKDVMSGGTMNFTRANAHFFADEGEELFSPTQRQRIIRDIMEADNFSGGAGLSVLRLERDGVVSKIFPLHSPLEVERLRREWAHFNVLQWYRPQPLDRVRAYWGEELAFYFAWVGFYNKLLAPIAVIGAGIFVAQFFDPTGYGNVIYCIIMMIWSTVFLELWKRRNNELAFHWNVLDFKESEASRAEYRGDEHLGVWSMGVWVPFDPRDEVLKRPFVRVVPTRYEAPSSMRSRVTASCVPVAVFLAAVFVLSLTVLGVRLVLQNQVHAAYGGLIGSFIGACVILFLNFLYKRLARILTDWENHRTDSEHDRALVAKVFLFQFVNLCTMLYYIAFFKQYGFDFFQKNEQGESALSDSCKDLPFPLFEVQANDGSGSQQIYGRGCIGDTEVQLGTYLLVQMTFGQLQEVLRPKMLVWWRRLFGRKSYGMRAEGDARPEWEMQAKLNRFEGTFDEYNELVLQFALVTIFSAAFPLSPLLALINNVVEIRTDAYKILLTWHKPYYKGARDIGAWYSILMVTSLIAVSTNCAMIVLQFPVTALLGITTPFGWLVSIVALERFLFIAKWALMFLIPDMPAPVQRELARLTFLTNSAVSKLFQDKPHFSFQLEPADYEDFSPEATYQEGAIIEPDEIVITYNVDVKEFINETLKRPKKGKKSKK